MNIRHFSPARSTSGSLRLELHGTRSFEARAEGTLRCLVGRCWVTRAGDPRDYLLLAGEEYTVSAHESVVVEALDTAWIAVSESLVERSAVRAPGIMRWATGRGSSYSPVKRLHPRSSVR
ncbi:MAG: hypothetical protein K0Q72_3081 [Armatimonadetes bacterium]|nr:hypothetical protein [Armatimonadota bacterium]